MKVIVPLASTVRVIAVGFTGIGVTSTRFVPDGTESNIRLSRLLHMLLYASLDEASLHEASLNQLGQNKKRRQAYCEIVALPSA